MGCCLGNMFEENEGRCVSKDMFTSIQISLVMINVKPMNKYLLRCIEWACAYRCLKKKNIVRYCNVNFFVTEEIIRRMPCQIKWSSVPDTLSIFTIWTLCNWDRSEGSNIQGCNFTKSTGEKVKFKAMLNLNSLFYFLNCWQ